MFRSGNSFKYDLNGQHGNYKLKLASFEVSTQEICKESAEHKVDLQNLKIQSDNMKRTFNQDYAEVRRNITEEIDDFKNKLKMEFNQQGIKTLENQRAIALLSNDLLETKNLVIELKHRLAGLKLRIEGDVDQH